MPSASVLDCKDRHPLRMIRSRHLVVCSAWQDIERRVMVHLPDLSHSALQALEMLFNLGALDDEGLLSRLGRKMAEFPMEPPMSKASATPEA